MHEELESFIRSSTKVPKSAFTYGNGPLGAKRLRIAVATFLNRRLMPVIPLATEHVIITDGVSHS